MEDKALGIIEVIGLTLAIEVLDSALKSANVNFFKMEKVGSGIISIMITGDVAATQAATAAAIVAGEKLGAIRSWVVIARPVNDVYKMFDTQKRIKTVSAERVVVDNIQKPIDDKSNIDVKKTKSGDNKGIAFEKMTVSDLRKLARELKLTNITKSEIKFAKRKQLVEKISEFKGDN